MTGYGIWASSKGGWEDCVFGEILEQNRGCGGVWEALREMQQSFTWRGPVFTRAENSLGPGGKVACSSGQGMMGIFRAASAFPPSHSLERP